MYPGIVLGPPGCGKTTTLLGAVEGELAAGTEPERIGFVSFTRKAAEEAISRASERFALERKRFPHFRTLHSMCFRMLGLRSSDVLEGKRLQDFAQYAGIRITGRWSEDGTLSGFEKGDRILFMENLARIRCIALRTQYNEDDDGLSWTEVQRVASALLQYKEREGLIDFSDMISQFVESAHRPELDMLIVDECQDISKLQWEMVRVLSEGCRRVLVAGDDDQCIYRWAGADAEHLIALEGDARVLDQSWRVPALIRDVAMQPLSHVKHRREKTWHPKRLPDGSVAQGAVGHARDFPDADSSGQDILVLARNTYILREQVEPELRRRGVLYERNGSPSIRPSYLAAIRNWEKLRRGGWLSIEEARDTYEFLTSGSGVTRGFKQLKQLEDKSKAEIPVCLEDLRKDGGLLTNAVWYDALERLPRDEIAYMRTAIQRGERPTARARVRISTIHASKGGESEHVILMKEMAYRTHAEMSKNPEDEARVWYVAATRAKERLTIVESQTAQRCPWL